MSVPRISFIKRVYWKLYERFLREPFSKEQYKALKALKCKISYNKYGGYCVPESSCHRPAARKILSKDVHEPKTIEFLSANCFDGDIVHAGTYFGDFLPALSQACAKGAKVWAFEPNPENYKCAAVTSSLNFIENVELYNAGLGEQKGSLPMLVEDKNGQAAGGSSRLLLNEEVNICGKKEMVNIVTIDEIVPENRKVSIIQLDVEGHEKEALGGALKTIKRCLPIIVVEVLQESDLLESEWFSKNILDLGYKMTDFIHKNSVFTCDSK